MRVGSNSAGALENLLAGPPKVVNVGLETFARDLRASGIEAVHVDWVPPAGGDAEMAALLARLGPSTDARTDPIEAANREAFSRMLAGDPVLVDVVPAGEAIAGLGERMILHAGPPIGWERMCGPMRGAVAGAIVFEKWAASLDEAAELAASGGIALHPNHHFGAVGPMTGLTTRSMPVLVVENARFGNRAYCTLNEGLGKVMRFGGNDEGVLKRLAWLRDVFAPELAKAVRAGGGIKLKSMVARGLTMGDELHQRNVACTSVFLREIAPILARTSSDRTVLAECFSFIAGNDQFFLNIAMAMGKAIMDPVKGIRGSTVVTAMSRNGTDFGIRVSGCGERWFVAPVEMPQGLYFPGFGESDANPDMGDSAIVETIGLGGFAMAAAPAVAGFVGAGLPSSAAGFTRAMADITIGENPEWTIPGLDFTGVPTGIDVRLVVDTGLAPTINTGIAHRKAGVGQVGAGIVKAPMAAFRSALLAIAEELQAS
jgi:hypothetical protein